MLSEGLSADFVSRFFVFVKSAVFNPAFTQLIAAATPAGPEPITMTSKVSLIKACNCSLSTGCFSDQADCLLMCRKRWWFLSPGKHKLFRTFAIFFLDYV